MCLRARVLAVCAWRASERRPARKQRCEMSETRRPLGHSRECERLSFGALPRRVGGLALAFFCYYDVAEVMEETYA